MDAPLTKHLAWATRQLRDSRFTCVLYNGAQVYTSCERGVAPLLRWLEENTPVAGCVAADRVVGKAAAHLYLLLGVLAVYAPVMSTPARELLADHGVMAVCDREVPAIRNRENTGFCPMETAVRDIEAPMAALTAIRERLAILQRKE